MRSWLTLPAVLLLSSLVAPVWAQDGVSSSSAPAATLPADIVLPRGGTVFVIDSKAGKPALLQLHAAEVVSNSHAASNFARSMVYVGARASFELKGTNAATNLQASPLSILVHLGGDDPELLRSRVHLIRLQQTKDHRLISNYAQNVFGGQRTKKFDDVPITKADVEPDVWLELTPDDPLTQGEYCVLFMPKDANAWPESVYDFDVAVDVAKPERASLGKS